MNFPLRTAFAVSHKFWIVVSSFALVSRNFLISSLILFLTHSLFNSMPFNLHEFECLGFFPWGWFLVSVPCGQRKCLTWFQFSWICWGLFCVLSCVYLWKCSTCIWKECAFCFFGMKGSLYISVKSISSRALFNATISLLIFCLEYLNIFNSEG